MTDAATGVQIDWEPTEQGLYDQQHYLCRGNDGCGALVAEEKRDQHVQFHEDMRAP